MEWFANHYKDFGAKLEFVTNKSQEGAQFVKGFGGIGGILRWKVDFMVGGGSRQAEEEGAGEGRSTSWQQMAAAGWPPPRCPPSASVECPLLLAPPACLLLQGMADAEALDAIKATTRSGRSAAADLDAMGGAGVPEGEEDDDDDEGGRPSQAYEEEVRRGEGGPESESGRERERVNTPPLPTQLDFM